MAAPCSRFTRTIIQRNQLPFARFSAAFYSARHPAQSKFNSDWQNHESFKFNVTEFLTYTVFFSGVGYTLYKRKDDIREYFRLQDSILPVAHALFENSDDNNRNKYNFIADVVKKSAPSVVYVEINDHRKADFFSGRSSISNGSGFIVGEDGLIVTSAHVVIHKPNASINVRLHDGSSYAGVVEDLDLQSDLATVRIQKKNLPVMKLGSSSSVMLGEFVVAMGSPLSLSNTITSGIVSSVRPSTELGLSNKAMEYIQTDAAITFGNSGGPLINLDGEAIGVNAMKLTAGISFAIPIDYVKDFLRKAELRRKGKGNVPVGVKNSLDHTGRRYIGITMLTLTPGMIFELQQRSEHMVSIISHGVFIYKVAIGSPAHRGGLKAGDIVTHINGTAIESSEDIYKILEKRGVLHFTVIREGKVLNIDITPEEG